MELETEVMLIPPPVQEEEHTHTDKGEEKSMPPTTSDKKIKLGGATRRRFRWLRRHGYSKEEATRMCRDPMGTHGTKKKRSRSEEEGERTRSSETTPVARSKRAKLSSSVQQSQEGKERERDMAPALSYRRALEGVRIGICCQEHPTVQLEGEQFELIKEALLLKIGEEPDREVKVRFYDIIWKGGWIQLVCSNQETADWVLENGPLLTPWEGAKLKVLKEQDLPRRSTLIVYLPKTNKEDKALLNLLRAQNPKDLRIESWRVYSRDDSMPKITQLAMGIDEDTAHKLLEGRDMLHYGFHSLKYRVIGGRKGKEARGGEDSVPVVEKTQEREEGVATVDREKGKDKQVARTPEGSEGRGREEKRAGEATAKKDDTRPSTSRKEEEEEERRKRSRRPPLAHSHRDKEEGRGRQDGRRHSTPTRRERHHSPGRRREDDRMEWRTEKRRPRGSGKRSPIPRP